MTRDIYGEALNNYYIHQKEVAPLLLHSSYGDIEEMPVDIFFRDEDEIPELEFIALSLCDGRVLDVGAGVGCHTLYLQDKNFDVEALEVSNIACQIMQQRGVQKIHHNDFYQFKDHKYDTLLFLMNGIGLAGDIEGFKNLLIHAESILTDRGQLIFDTSNIEYLYEEYKIKRPDHYFGEINYQYQYQGNFGDKFKWLYLDQKMLIKIAHELNWVVQILFEDEHDQYLVRMEKRK